MAETKLKEPVVSPASSAAGASSALCREDALRDKLRIKLDYEQLTNCMRCGFCLPACPTFRETGVEAESPRGRIALMKAVTDGLMKPDAGFEEQMNHCLGCRACEPACPADVKYGQLIEQARDAVEDHTESHRWWVKAIRRTAFKGVFPHQNRMRLLGGALALYQKSGLNRLVRGVGVMNLFPAHMRDMEKILPEASYAGVIERTGATRHPAKGEAIAKVGMFRGCIMDVLFTETNVHTVKLLNEAGFEVVIPSAQNCCGALHAHSGETDGAQSLARGNIRAFREAGVDYIVSNAGGCGAILAEYDHLLHDDEAWREEAKWFADRVIDISELLVRRGRPLRFSREASSSAGVPMPGAGPGAYEAAGSANTRQSRTDAAAPASAEVRSDRLSEAAPSLASPSAAAPLRITYQDSCHLRNVMRSSDAPRRLMKQIEGVAFVELKEADRCCGSAGIYNLTQPEMAGQILEHKMEHVNAAASSFVLTSNPGCLLQMKLGISRHGDENATKAEHIVDFLYRHLQQGETPERADS